MSTEVKKNWRIRPFGGNNTVCILHNIYVFPITLRYNSSGYHQDNRRLDNVSDGAR
jgi:hypothetical protein